VTDLNTLQVGSQLFCTVKHPVLQNLLAFLTAKSLNIVLVQLNRKTSWLANCLLAIATPWVNTVDLLWSSGNAINSDSLINAVLQLRKKAITKLRVHGIK
jgi:hypothetical protein